MSHYRELEKEHSMNRRYGILTSGRDCPGLNAAIKAAVEKFNEEDNEVIGILDGWKGLVEELPENFMPLDTKSVRTIDRSGGTILGSSRIDPFLIDSGVERLIARYNAYQLSGLVAIGGEVTMGVAGKLHQLNKIKVVGIPKSVDSDLAGTDYTLGFETSVQIISDAIDSLRTTAGSRSHIFIVETLGCHVGHLALEGGMSGSASVILIPEHPFDLKKLCDLLLQKRQSGHRYSIIVVAEGSRPIERGKFYQGEERDELGHRVLGGVGSWLAREIEKRVGLEARGVVLSHLQRGGAPVAYDRRMGLYFGTAAAELLLNGESGKMVAVKDGRMTSIELSEVMGRTKLVNVAAEYDTERYNVKRHILGGGGRLLSSDVTRELKTLEHEQQ
jgi:6-phosphofructokinase 1